MTSPILRTDPEPESITALAAERNALDQLAELLNREPEGAGTLCRLKLVAPDGRTVDLPESVFRLLRSVAPYLAKGQAVISIPLHPELTTQEAADILNVSRPFMIGLLESGEIPYVKTGRHRRIRLEDLMRYKRLRDARRRQTLDRLTRISQEFGLDAYED